MQPRPAFADLILLVECYVHYFLGLLVIFWVLFLVTCSPSMGFREEKAIIDLKYFENIFENKIGKFYLVWQ